jgi:hypothetical protein
LASSRVTTILVAMILSTGAGTHLAAQGEETAPLVDLNRQVSFEIAPHTGLMGSSGVLGIQLAMNYSSLTLELSADQVVGRMANLYPLSVNAVLNLTTRGRLIPYGVVGAGLLMTVPTNTIGDETITSLGLNFGGGARYFITRTFGIRVEAKQLMTSVPNRMDNRNELLFFQQVNLGVTFLLY